MSAVSIFNDVIGPVMRGPSSSHCAAALRIGRLARDLMEGEIAEVLVEFDRSGSLPTTHESQGSDMGLFGGLLGWDADDERLPGSAQALADAGIKLRIETVDVGDPHPNTYRLTLRNAREQHTLIAISTGGGMMEVLSIDDVPLRMDGGYHETLIWLPKGANAEFEADAVLHHDAGKHQIIQVKAAAFVIADHLPATTVKRLSPVLPVPSRKDMRVPFTSCAAMLTHDGDQHTPLWQLAVQYEMARGDFTEREVIDKMITIVRILRKSIASGIAGTQYDDRVLGHQSGRFHELMQAGKLLDGGALNRIVLYVTALMEVKSSMGVIVAAPTAGACAALPGAVIGMSESLDKSEEDMAKAMLAAGLIGVFIATRWTFAAEVGGCQAEGGAAASMAAAALVTLAGGTRDQAIAAASMAFQSMLGLICDPIANRVEAPCLGKNVMAASNALSCANMALAGYDPLIPLDEVIDAAKNVASMMPREHRCTSLGGLAITPTSLEIERKLGASKAQSCGGCQSC
ncbi:MAG: L-serine ammonia-lyase, iron-sulfur-dependent, subunit alpha [Prosthecobacter sp.]|uniref:L-serine ammonia-lyase, iron-sulfur-dependent, subunit alpha n=1 Tax=Prosthecobacter sp. TaxID=1965333 RepID=UPI002600F8D8|nr:L-serine ammonia-lyase, iron-sulfur-dependent, subunit alpha [Prosthecobacter sp.]MCF7784817.1 L-serine ammonia-lyase, iron-sulfur-dependent, subunit alpha [Prosthecobacter sp.]